MKRKPIKFESELIGWVKSRAEAHETSARALPKGNKPFSPAKMKAAYMSLVSQRVFPLSVVARQCGVKYGVLKVWRTEGRFKEQVARNMDEYAEVFKGRFLERISDSESMERLSLDFFVYSIPLKMRIVSLLLSAHVKDDSLEGSELKLTVISLVNILLQRTIEHLMAERPMKTSVMEEILHLQNFQIFLLTDIRKNFYDNVIDKTLIKGIILKHARSGRAELERVLKAIRFVDSEVDKTLRWRMGWENR